MSYNQHHKSHRLRTYDDQIPNYQQPKSISQSQKYNSNFFVSKLQLIYGKSWTKAGISLITDYRRPERKQSSLHGQKFYPNPKFLGTAEAYFVCHIGPIFQISLVYTFIGCPWSVAVNIAVVLGLCDNGLDLRDHSQTTLPHFFGFYNPSSLSYPVSSDSLFYSTPSIFAVLRNLVQEIWLEKSGWRNLVQEKWLTRKKGGFIP